MTMNPATRMTPAAAAAVRDRKRRCSQSWELWVATAAAMAMLMAGTNGWTIR